MAEINFKQKGDCACGLTVCRAIINKIIGKHLSEEEMIEVVRQHYFISNEGWNNDISALINNKKVFIDSGGNYGSVPTECLIELLNLYKIPNCGREDNVETSDIKSNAIVILEWEYKPGNYHAVLLRDVNDKEVVYMDPKDGNDVTESIEDFNKKREHKKLKSDKYSLLEIVRILD